MADIELVIKISEEKLSTIKNKMYCGIYDAELYKAIATGTPLPKGHGRLIDADKAILKLCGSACGCRLEECGFSKPCYSVGTLIVAPTIVEKDDD